MKLLRGYKFRIYPNKEQEVALAKNFGCVRFIYNHMLAKKIKAYETENKRLSRFGLSEILTEMKTREEYKWLNEVNSQSLQAALRDLDNAFTRFFREKKGFPNFKSKKTNRRSFQCPQNVKIDFENNKLTIPKIKNIKIKPHRTFKGKVKTVTISKTPTNKYYVSILVEVRAIKIKKPEINSNTTIGIDLGLTHFATLSTGGKIDNPKHLKNSLQKLKVMQKRLSRKRKGSQNRIKARLKVAHIHEKITNQRLDFIHKITYSLTHDSQVDTIVMETLNTNGMMKNHHLAQAISDVGWSMFDNQLKYKCGWYNKNHLKIGMFEPSSKICNVCGEKNNELALADREWMCENCGESHDRDENAAINIKKFGLQDQNLIGGQGLPSLKPVESSQ